MGKDELLHFRLRSERSRERIRREDLEKQVRQKVKQKRELWKQRRDMPFVPLEKPYQKGFVRFFVVREDVLRSKDAAFFQELLLKINTFFYSENKKFQKRKRKYGRKIYVDRIQNLKKLNLREWKDPKLGLTEKERSYFVRVEEYSHRKKCVDIYYEFTEAWRYVLRIKPNMITHYKPVDVELERELSLLDSFLERDKNKGIYYKKIIGGSSKWRRKPEDKNPLKQSNFSSQITSATEIVEQFMDFGVHDFKI